MDSGAITQALLINLSIPAQTLADRDPRSRILFGLGPYQALGILKVLTNPAGVRTSLSSRNLIARLDVP